MGSPTAERSGIQRAFFLTLCMVLATLPLSHVQAVDMGDPYNLQAQGIQATFDSTTETTVITWQNIEQTSKEAPAACPRWGAGEVVLAHRA